jgi:cruciform cutting endonuclease 1
VVDWRRVDVLPKKESSEDDSDNDDYSPAHLAPAAVSLVRDTFLPVRPDLIAIERQRFRSGGGSAVLEWTLRVNMLEGMLYSAFNSFPVTSALIGVSPARVARFWVPKVAGGKATVEKKQKVEVVRHWLRGTGPEGLSIGIGVEVKDISETVLNGRIAGTGKVDDLADCLLQVGALATWEKNRRTLASMSEQNLLDYCNRLATEKNNNDE